MNPATTGTTAPAPARPLAQTIAGFLLRHIMVVVMLLIVAFFMYRSARFGTPDNLVTILVAAAPFALIALGQTLVILTGGIDLSVGSVIAVSAMAAAWSAKNVSENPAVPPVAALGAGLAAGVVNGLVVSRLNVPPFITTLGMLTLASGLAYVIGNGAPINGLPASYGTFANTQFLGLKIPVLLMIVAILVFAFVMRSTSYGLRIYAIGGNRLAAEIAGVRSRNVLFSVYALSGLLAGISGLMLSSRVITGAPNLGQGYELDAIAAVVIGGASLMGGRGTVWGTAIGLLLIQTINNGLDILLVPSYWQSVIKGVIIVAAVGVDVWAARRGR
ncbi:ABC transporter permease [Sinomonas sp. ASV322]|uniref:ABC transporter permease n=1 Tax=Sinomonas sp. ASV322 TaxID=3041920 RepID=UPI0027DBC1D4|nr:ABC transporter permease [Sinomonas sp. ASV322]MDQ4504022.1 ABC transporter permease [Sinomonas sp. ASV322]